MILVSAYQVITKFDAYLYFINDIEKLSEYTKAQKIVLITNKFDALYKSQYYEFTLYNNQITAFWEDYDKIQPDFISIELIIEGIMKQGKIKHILKYKKHEWKHY
tara:strand:- start:2104 stop:2418 length:315 start_codon:yes stop_codon:yes gene_type:complete